MVARTYTFGDILRLVLGILLFLLFIWPAFLFDSPLFGKWNDWTDDDDRIVSAYSNDDLEERIDRNIEELEDAGWDEDDIEDLRADIRDELDDLDDDASRSEVRAAITNAVTNFQRDPSSGDGAGDSATATVGTRAAGATSTVGQQAIATQGPAQPQGGDGQPTQTSMPAPAPAEPTVHTNGFVTYDYEPGGESFGMWDPKEIIPPDGRTDCGRVWQATNLVNTAWTTLFCGWKASDGVQMQWVHPFQMNVSGNGTVEFDLYRDLHAVEQLQTGQWGWDGRDPYDVSLGNGQLGLGWHVSGAPGTACVNDKCVELGTGAFQLDFPRDWTGHHHVVLTVNGGMLTFYEGPRVTSENTWDAQ